MLKNELLEIIANMENSGADFKRDNIRPEKLAKESIEGTSLESIDLVRLNYYLKDILKDPAIPENKEEWLKRLLALGLMAEDGFGNKVCTIAGLICFGINPRRYLKQAGLRIMAFPGVDKEYLALLDTVLDAPLVGRWRITASGQKELIDQGLIEKFTAILEPFITIESDTIDQHMRREKTWFYPWEALREAVINALAHRDWTKSVDIEITNYKDRLEIISPGRLQNSMTIEKMIAGQRYPRNPLIMEVLRDYGYVDSRGMGVRTKIIPLMKKINGIDPIFEATEDYLKCILPRKKS